MAFAFSISTLAKADGSSMGDDTGTMSFNSQPNISMDKESFFISEEQIKVNYLFTNTRIPASKI
jgi:hypothetical protein